MLVVIDTNVLVSALWSKNGAPAKIISLVLQGKLIPCYDYRILSEYRTVLARPKFGFTDGEINALLDWIEIYGRSILAEPLEDIFIDESDKKFFEVAKYSNKKYFDIMQKRGWEVISPKPRIGRLHKFGLILKAFFK